MKYIGVKWLDVYYTWSKNYHPGLELVADKDKVVGNELRIILFHLQTLHHPGGKNFLPLHHHNITD